MSLKNLLRHIELETQRRAYTTNPDWSRLSLSEIKKMFGQETRLAFEDLDAANRRVVKLIRGS